MPYRESGYRVDIQVLIQSGYLGIYIEWISRCRYIVHSQVWIQSGYPGIYI